MAAYLIADLEVTNPEVFEEYRSLVAPSVEKYGGRYLIRGGAVEALEGGWEPKRLVLLEFESMERAKEWYFSEEYTRIKQIRFRSANTNALLVEGA